MVGKGWEIFAAGAICKRGFGDSAQHGHLCMAFFCWADAFHQLGSNRAHINIRFSSCPITQALALVRMVDLSQGSGRVCKLASDPELSRLVRALYRDQRRQSSLQSVVDGLSLELAFSPAPTRPEPSQASKVLICCTTHRPLTPRGPNFFRLNLCCLPGC